MQHLLCEAPVLRLLHKYAMHYSMKLWCVSIYMGTSNGFLDDTIGFVQHSSMASFRISRKFCCIPLDTMPRHVQLCAQMPTSLSASATPNPSHY